MKTTKLGDHAIVLGGGISGLLAARALLGAYGKVSIVDKEKPLASPSVRRRLPQHAHVQLILARGLRDLNALVPTFEERLSVWGVPPVDAAKHTRFYLNGELAPVYSSGIRFVVCSRPLLEWILLSELGSHPRFEFLGERTVEHLVGDRAQVTGVRVKSSGEVIEADLVVNALGLLSSPASLVEPLGVEIPSETTIDTFSGYVSRQFQLDDGYRPDWRFLQVRKLPTKITRGIYVGIVENGHVLISLAGGMKNYPPTDETGYHEAIAEMKCPLVSDLLLHATATSPVFSYRSLANRWSHWQSVRLPRGFVSLGDSFVRVNPDYGAGITVASTSAMTLQRHLSHGTLDSNLFQASLAGAVRPYWDFVARQERVWLRSQAEKPTRTLVATVRRTYLKTFWALAIAKHRREVYQSAIEVLHLLKPQKTQFYPRTWFRMLRGGAGLIWDRFRLRSRPDLSGDLRGAL